jgi:outer membrane protein W
MKKITTVLVAVLLLTVSYTNGQSFEKGNKLLNVSVGLAPTFGVTSISGFGFSTKWSPPISASFEFGVSDRISVGAVGGFATQKFVDNANDGVQYDYLLIGARGSYHFATSEKFDPYAGITLGYNNVTAKEVGSGSGGGFSVAASSVLYGAHLGARYYFSDAIGAHAELGYGISVISIGLSLKF